MSKSKLRPGDLGAPLSEKEFEELDDFLTSDQTSDETANDRWAWTAI